MSRMLAESNAALAGVMLETSLARLRASTAAFKEERAPSRPFSRWDSVVMVQAQGSCEENVRGSLGSVWSPSCHHDSSRDRLITQNFFYPTYRSRCPGEVLRILAAGATVSPLFRVKFTLDLALPVASSETHFGTPIHHLAFHFPQSSCPQHPLIIPVFFHVN